MSSLCTIPLWLSVAESIKVKSRLNHCHRQIEKFKKHSYNLTPLTTKTTTVPTTILSGVVAHWIRQHDGTMVDEYKYDRTTPNTHTNKDIQMSPFHKFDSANNVIPSLYRFEVLYKVCIWNLQNEIRQLNRDIPTVIVTLYLIHLPMGCAPNAQLLNDDVTAIELSYWRRRESPNYPRQHRGRMFTKALVSVGLKYSMYCTCNLSWMTYRISFLFTFFRNSLDPIPWLYK